MKQLFCASWISLLLLSCGGSGDSGSNTVKNTAPTPPVLTAPTTNKLCIDNTVTFQWNPSTDLENNAVTYQIQIATDNQFTQIIKATTTSLPTLTTTLSKGVAYYWRVKAIDSNNDSSSYSATYSFYTEATALSNHLPFLPQLVLPEFNTTINGTTTTLSWTASDVDSNDILTYDVYLEAANPPTIKVGTAITTSTLTTSSLQAATIYYWKVVVKDNKGGETIGQVWKFKTN